MKTMIIHVSLIAEQFNLLPKSFHIETIFSFYLASKVFLPLSLTFRKYFLLHLKHTIFSHSFNCYKNNCRTSYLPKKLVFYYVLRLIFMLHQIGPD